VGARLPPHALPSCAQAPFSNDWERLCQRQGAAQMEPTLPLLPR
jgi:hypothetical protein